MSSADLEGLALGRGGEAREHRASDASYRGATYAALDLGTNNCRLLVAKPTQSGFRVVDSFSRIVRLGEGLSVSGHLSESAVLRTFSALEICRAKMASRGVTRARLIATEACRMAINGPAFVARARDLTGLDLEVVDRETEAHLAAAGCAGLADPMARGTLLFDIGGGSSEVVWLAGGKEEGADLPSIETMRHRVRDWISLPIGVVTLAEKYGGVEVSDDIFEAMTLQVSAALRPFVERVSREPRCRRFHLLGTSGTVTTIAGVHLNLVRYDRRQVDGLWMGADEVQSAVQRLRRMSYEQRVAHGCIGAGRADLVLAGCAILEGISRAFPANCVRIADRGLREGILTQLMSADRVWGAAGCAQEGV